VTRHHIRVLSAAVAAVIGCGGCSKVLAPARSSGSLDVAVERSGEGGRHSPPAASMDRATPGSSEFYPLVVGETRRYLYTTSSQTIWDDGHVDPVRASSSIHEREIVCEEQRDGRTYYVESFKRSAGGDRIYYWLRYHQDRTGLFADYSLARTPPACGAHDSGGDPIAGLDADAEMTPFVPGGVALVGAGVRRSSGLGEVAVLRYPLHPGSRWPMEEGNPQFEAVVEGRDVIDTPAGRFVAWRILLPKEDPSSANNPQRVWYSREGFIKREWTSEYTATSGHGGTYRVVGSYSEVLISRTLNSH
jgi:hypothetical protein